MAMTTSNSIRVKALRSRLNKNPFFCCFVKPIIKASRKLAERGYDIPAGENVNFNHDVTRLYQDS
jgi:hypothetical protein